MADKKFDAEENLDDAQYDHRGSSTRMLGGLVLTIILYPFFAVWLFFHGFSIFQILMIVWLSGAVFFVGLLVVADWVVERKKTASKRREVPRIQMQDFPRGDPNSPKRRGRGIANLAKLRRVRSWGSVQFATPRKRPASAPKLSLVKSS